MVTGATGRTGSLIYKALKKSGALGQTRALVRSVESARERLGCSACDASEGIFVGDLTNPDSLGPAFDGVTALAIATGVSGTEDEKTIKAVELQGVKNQVAAFLKGGVAGKRVAMISAMGTDRPSLNTIEFYKLNAEAFLASAGVPFTIVKPCGLADSAGDDVEVMVGHDAEAWFDQGFYMVPREDVANVMAASLISPPAEAIRFDICAKTAGSGPPKPAEQLLKEALLPWQQAKAGARLVI